MGQHDDAEEHDTDQIEAREAGAQVQRLVEDDVVDDVAHEQRLDHLQAGHRQREHKYGGQPLAGGGQPPGGLGGVRPGGPPAPRGGGGGGPPPPPFFFSGGGGFYSCHI